MLKLNLQYFAEDDGDGIDDNNGHYDDTSNSDDNDDVIDSETFAELIAERDKKIDDLVNQISELKKSNANLLVKISAGTEKNTKSFEENLLSLVGYPTRKE